MANTLSDNALVRAREDVVSCALGDGVALLDLSTSTYYSLNPVGAHVWEAIKSPATILAIRRSIVETFDVSPAVCQTDLMVLLGQLHSAKLVEITDASPA